MDASPDAVGGEKIMDAPPAASTSSYGSCKDFQPHPPPPLSRSNVDRHNWTKKYEETGHGFPRGAKVTVSLSPFSFSLPLAHATSFSAFSIPIIQSVVKMIHRQRSLIPEVS